MNARKALLALAALAAITASSHAEDFKAGALTIAAPWARASIGEATNSAAYMKIENSGDAPDRLSRSSPTPPTTSCCTRAAWRTA